MQNHMPIRNEQSFSFLQVIRAVVSQGLLNENFLFVPENNFKTIPSNLVNAPDPFFGTASMQNAEPKKNRLRKSISKQKNWNGCVPGAPDLRGCTFGDVRFKKVENLSDKFHF